MIAADQSWFEKKFRKIISLITYFFVNIKNRQYGDNNINLPPHNLICKIGIKFDFGFIFLFHIYYAKDHQSYSQKLNIDRNSISIKTLKKHV